MTILDLYKMHFLRTKEILRTVMEIILCNGLNNDIRRYGIISSEMSKQKMEIESD